MKDINEQPHIKIGDTVWWVHYSNKCYKGTVKEYSFCEGQGAVYLHIFSPSFRRNPYPVVHYSFCFLTREQAKKFIEYLKLGDTFCKRCDRCEFNAIISGEEYKEVS